MQELKDIKQNFLFFNFIFQLLFTFDSTLY